MPLDNNPKKIPQLTAIPTPTAWNETDIETVVAKESTYANYKMTLAQIYTLATVSGSIKTALDALSALIATNTSNISTLSTTKLNTVGGIRTGLTANRALITDASGNETYLTWSSNQVIWFDWAGKPIAVTPSVDIVGLTSKDAPVWDDFLLLSDSEASFVNKKIKLSEVGVVPYINPWTGSDGVFSISSGTTTIPFPSSAYTVVKNYTAFTMTGGTLAFSGSPTNGGIAIIRVQWDCSITGGTIDMSWHGGKLIWNNSNWNQWIDEWWSLRTSFWYLGYWANQGDGWVSNLYTTYILYCGAAWGSSLSTTPNWEGNGGGILILEVGWNLTISGSAILDCSWKSGGTQNIWGWAAGSIWVKARWTTNVTTSCLKVDGGAGWTGSSTPNSNVWWGGASYWYGGWYNTAWYTSPYGVGGWVSWKLNGGGSAWFYKIN